MRYRDITVDDGRFQLPRSHPFLAELHLDPSVWDDFQRLLADDPDSRILNYGTSQSGLMKVLIACASREVRTRLEDGWE